MAGLRETKTSSCPEEHRLDAFVARTLGADDRVALEAHFDSCDDCRRLIFALTEDDGGTDARRIGRYLITRQLGEGAMGVVFAARDPALQRDVAIKLLRGPAASHPEAATRLRREAQGLARLAHPNVVSIFDVGTHGDEVYLAMELIRGTSLDRWLASARVWPAVMRVLVQAARGLAAAHDAGLVHRDIKPHNVMVTVDDRVKIVDFGLAHGSESSRHAEAPSSDHVDQLAVRVTETGAIVGTPAYSAPEVLDGGVADRRSDVFSFCVMAFEALYGRHPFEAATVADLRTRLAQPIELPRSPRLPRTLQRMLLRGLQSDRDARPATLHPLVSAMRAALWPRRRIAAGVVAGFGIVIGTAALAMQLAGAPDAGAVCDAAAEPPEVAYDAEAIRAAFAATTKSGAAVSGRVIDRIEAWRRDAGALKGSACRASRIEGIESPELFDRRIECVARSTDRVVALVGQLQKPTPILVDDSLDAIQKATDLAPCDSRRARLAPQLPVDPALRAQAAALQTRLANIAAVDATGRHAEASRDATAVAEEAARASLRDVEADAWMAVGLAHTGAQERLAARAANQRALVASEAIGDSSRRAEIYVRLVTIDNHLERYQDARQWAAQARSLFENLGDRSLEWRITWVEAANAVNDDPKRSLALIRKTIEQRDRISTVEDNTSVELVRSLGAAQVAAGEIEEGKRTLQRALELGEKRFGPTHPQLIDTLTALGIASATIIKPADALPHLERAFAIAEATAGREHARLPMTALVLGGVYGELMRVQDAVNVFDRTVAAFKPAYGETSPAFADVLAMRAEMVVLAGYDLETDERRRKAQFARALADKLAALAIYRTSLSPDSAKLAEALERLGRVQRFLDTPADAIRSFEEARAIRARDPKPQPGAMEEAELGLGGALTDAGRAAEAVPHLEAALAIAEARGMLVGASSIADAKAELAAALIALRRDRPRAVRLLRDARSVYVAMEEPNDIGEVDRMLARLGTK